MLHIAVPWWELVLRSTVVYLFLILILRISGAVLENNGSISVVPRKA